MQKLQFPRRHASKYEITDRTRRQRRFDDPRAVPGDGNDIGIDLDPGSTAKAANDSCGTNLASYKNGFTMKIEMWPLERLKEYDRNPRDNDAAVEPVARSIREFGFKVPIVVDTEGVIIAGHTRVKAARKLGLASVPVIIASDLSPDQVRAYRIADNRLAEMAQWNVELLPIELADLQNAA